MEVVFRFWPGHYVGLCDKKILCMNVFALKKRLFVYNCRLLLSR